jgi:hypothetical protein
VALPNINIGQIALDPYNKVLYYKNLDGQLIRSTLDWLQDVSFNDINTTDDVYIDADLEVTGSVTVGQDLNIGSSVIITEDLSIGQDLTVTGNLIVNGTTTTINTENVTIEDNILILNSNATGAPTVNSGLEVERGSATNVSIRWNESSDYWEFTNDGTTYQKMVVDINDINDVVITSVQSGDFLKYNGTNWVNDPINLTTDTVGDYVSHLAAGTGIFLSNNSGEAATPTISIGQPVEVTDDVTFNTVTADLIGNVTGNVTGRVSDISDHPLNELSDVVINNPQNGDFLRYNNAGNWINDPVNLTTDTVGDYVAKLAAGTGITITNNSGEGATPNIAFSGTIDNITDVVITSAQNGQILEYDGTSWVNTVRPSSEPIGHENKADSVMSFDEGSRQFSIAPASTSYTVWCTGKRYVKTTTESVTIPDTSGLYYIYFNSSGSLAYKTTFFTWDQDTPTAYIYWNENDNKAYFFADERHGVTLDWATHEYLHRTRGAAIANGFGVNNYTLVGDGSLDAHAKIDIANGTFFDEDLQVDIEHAASPTANTWQQRLQSGAYIPVFYRLNNHWTKDVATQFPVKNSGTRAGFNLNTTGSWSATEIDNNKYGVMFVVATNNLNEPIISIMGQSQYTDQGSAEASAWDELDLAGFPIVEFRPLYKIVFQTANAYTNSPKTRFVNLLDLRTVLSSGDGLLSVPVSDHGNMTGLSDDDHTQYLNETRHDLDDHDVLIASLDTDQIQEGVANLYFTDQRAFDAIQGATPTFDSVTTTSLFLDGIEIYPDGVTNTQVLKYDSGLNKFVAGDATVIATLDELSDVVITNATPNQILKWSGENWINAEPPSAAGSNNYTTNIGDGTSTSITVTHNLSTRDLVVFFYETSSPYENFFTDWHAPTLNTIVVSFATPPGTNSVRVLIAS